MDNENARKMVAIWCDCINGNDNEYVILCLAAGGKLDIRMKREKKKSRLKTDACACQLSNHRPRDLAYSALAPNMNLGITRLHMHSPSRKPS